MNLRLMRVMGTMVLMAGALAFAGGKEEAKKETSTKVESNENLITLDGSTTVGPIAKAFAEEFMKANPGVKVQVSESGSGNGAKSLLNQSCDIANLSRFMKDKEFAACVEKGVLPVAHVVALDGIAPIVHPSNPVKNLTIEQLKSIYLGEIKNWKDVGGPNKPIVVISRDTNSGTYDTWQHFVTTSTGKVVSSAEYVGSNGAVRARVAATPNAIGYVGVGYIDDSVRATNVNGVEASVTTVRNGTFPISRPLFMFTNGYPKLGSLTQRFVTMHLTPMGQRIISSVGFIPLTDYPVSK